MTDGVIKVAKALNSSGVRCVGPQTGIELCVLIKEIDAMDTASIDAATVRRIKAFRQSLLTVCAVQLAQQQLVLGIVNALVSEPKAKPARGGRR